MIKTFKLLMVAGVAAGTSMAVPGAACAQSTPQSRVDLPRFEVAASIPFKQVTDAGSNRRWTGPGVSVTIDRYLTRQLAVAGEVETDGHDATAFLGGAQVSTGFYYGSSRDPVPGRFFGRVLAGVRNSSLAGVQPSGQIAAGTDILLSRTRPIGLRWEAGYDLNAGAVVRHATGRVAVGLIFGPRLHR